MATTKHAVVTIHNTKYHKWDVLGYWDTKLQTPYTDTWEASLFVTARTKK